MKLFQDYVKLTSWLLTVFAFTACTAIFEPAAEPKLNNPSSPPTVESETTATPAGLSAADLPDLGLAPDINNEIWLNTEQPLNLESVRGKVVLVEFWTFG